MLGRGFDLLEDEDDETRYSLRVTGEGPYCALDPVEFDIRPGDWREARDAPEGNLHFVRKEIEQLAGETKMLREHSQQKDIVALSRSDFIETTLADSIVQHRQEVLKASEDSEEA